MPRNKKLDEIKKQRIRERYELLKLEKDRKFGTPKYSDATVWAMLIDEFLLTRRTLEGIIYYRAEKRSSNQMDLFE